MNDQQLNMDIKKQFSDMLEKKPWPESLTQISDTSDKKSVDFIRNEISKRYTNWSGFLSPSSNIAIVIESGLGANVVSLAKTHKNVYVNYVDDYTQKIVESRLEYLDISNVKAISFDAESLLQSVSEKVIVVAFNEGNDPNIEELTLKALRTYKNSDLYYVCSNDYIRKVKSDFDMQLDVFHYTGSSRNPFQIIPSSEKQKDIGIVKYKIKTYLPFLFKEYVALTTLTFQGSVYEAICIEVRNKLYNNNENIVFIKFFISKPNGAIVFIKINNDAMVIRIAVDGLAKKRLASSTSALTNINKVFDNLAPKLLLNDTSYGIDYAVEQMFAGGNIKDSDLKSDENRLDIISQSFDKLISLHKHSLSLSVLNNDNYTKHISTTIDLARSLFKDDFSEIFDLIEKYLKLHLYDEEIPLVTTHGDFSIDNIIVKNGVVTGIIDWDYSSVIGLPLIDVVFFVASTYKRQEGYSGEYMLINAITHDCFSDNDKYLIDNYCNEINLDKTLIQPLSIMYVMHHIAYRLEQGEKYLYYGFYESMFMEILNVIKKEVLS